MTGEVVNLNKARKARATEDAKATAEANRLAHGQTKATKARTKREKERRDQLLDGAKRGE